MTDGKSILIIAGYAPSLTNFRGRLIEKLVTLGWKVSVAAPDFESFPDVTNFLSKLGVSYKSITLARNGLNPLADFKTCLLIRTLVKKTSPDVVLAYTIKPIVWGGIALYGIKNVRFYALVTGLGFAFKKNGFLSTILSKIVSSLYFCSLQRSSAVIFQNEDDQFIFTSNKIVSIEKCKIVNGSGVDLEQFSVASLPAGAPYKFLLIARLLKDKGVLEYVSAAKIVKQKYPNTEFHLVGWIDTNPAAIKQEDLDEWIRDGMVHFHGRIADVRDVIKNCHVYVLPSYREGTPRTVLEAMAVGRAVITANAPGCKETVIDGYNGYLVPVGDSTELAVKMISFIEEPEKIATMAIASRAYVEKKYCINKVNEQMLSFMDISNEANS